MEEILKQRALSFMIPADHSHQSAGPVETPRHSSSAAASAPSEFREFSPLSEGETGVPLSLKNIILSSPDSEPGTKGPGFSQSLALQNDQWI